MNSFRRLLLLCLLLTIALPFVDSIAEAQQFNQSFYQSLRWRNIGPFRAGQTVAAGVFPIHRKFFFCDATNVGFCKPTAAVRP